MTSMIRLRFTLKSFFFMTVFMLPGARPYSALAQNGMEPTAVVLDILNAEQARQVRDAAKAEIDRLPAGAVPESPDGRLKASLERRLALLDEMQTLRDSEEQWTQLQSELPTRRRSAEESLKELAAGAAAELPSMPDTAAFKAFEQTLSTAKSDLAAKASIQVAQQRRFEVDLPRLIQDAQQRSAAAIKRRNDLASLTAGLTNTVERRTLDIQIENADFDAAVAQQLDKQLETELSLATELGQVLSLEHDLAEKRAAQLEQQFSRYSITLAETLTQETAAGERRVGNEGTRGPGGQDTG